MPLDALALIRDPSLARSLPLDLRLDLPASDLSGLRPLVPALRSLSGTGSLAATVAGTVTAPDVRGNLTATLPSLAFIGDEVPGVRDAALRLRFDGSRIEIERAEAMIAGGTVTLRGGADCRQPANPRLDLTLTAREALLVRDDNLSLRADADLRCRGSLTEATVDGRISLVRGRVFKELEFLPLSLPDQLPPAPPPVTMGRQAPPSLPPPFDRWRFDVAIGTREPVRLLGNVLNGGAVADLRLHGTGARPVLEGRAFLTDARIRLPFSRMNLTRGDLVFRPDKPFDPELDVLGDSFTGGHQVQLQAYGRALDPKLRLTSSPPLSEGDIAALLATGSTSEGMRSGEGEAANRAAFLVISQLYRKLFRRSRLMRETDEAPRLSFSFSPLNNAGGGRSFSAVYEINRNVEAIGTVNQSGSFRGLLYWLIRFR